MVLSVPGLLVGPTSGFTALLQLPSVLMFLAPEPPKAERIVLNRIGPSLAAALGRESRSGPSPTEALRREDPTPHLGSTIELTLFVGMGKVALRA